MKVDFYVKESLSIWYTLWSLSWSWSSRRFTMNQRSRQAEMSRQEQGRGFHDVEYVLPFNSGIYLHGRQHQLIGDG